MKTIKFVVGADGVVTCNGSRRAQKAGVQGDNKACTLEFDVSAVAKEKAKYFIECVLGNGTPLILSDESDGVRFADNVLSVVLDSAVSANGGTVEIRVVQVTAIDEMYAEVVEENTYSCFIYFESKSLAMVREKLRAYGVFLELKEYAKNLQGDANNKYNEANSKLSAAILAYENAMNALEQGVAINDEYFSFENGLLRLSQEYLAKISAQFDEKQGTFELNPDEALEFAEGANGKLVLRLKTSSEVYQDADGLHLNLGDGLKRTDDGYRIEVDSDVIPNKEYVNSLMSGALKRKVCEDGLPKENIDINTVYMVPAEESAENNIYNEFMNINGAWEQIGSTAVDLSDYVLKSSVDKELSSESSNPVQNKAVAEALNEANAITRQMNEKINKNSNDLFELGENKSDKTYVDEGLENKADKEKDFTLIQEVEVTDGETASIAFEGISKYKKLYLYATIAPAEKASAVTGVVRLTSGYGLVNGYVSNGINTTTQYYHLCLEKNNGLWVAWYGGTAKEGQDANLSLKHGVNAKQFNSDNYKVNLAHVVLNVGTSGVYFPIGTKVQLWGVE